jgi:glycosyltransferase involved in cell wall biosynthesis
VRVLLSIAEMSTGGAERIVVELANGLRGEGDAVAVAADSGPFDQLLLGSGVERYPVPGRGRSPLTAARASLRVRAAKRRFHPAVIHAHNVKATAVAVAATIGPRGRTLPLVTTFHGVRREEYRRAALILRFADAVACVSRDLIDGLADVGLPRERLRLIRNAVPLPQPLAEARREEIDRELALGGGPVVSMVGRLVEQKAPDRFLEAAAQVAAELPDCRFLLVGDGPLRSRLEALTRRLGLAERVRFTGVRRDARELIARSDLVVFSSDWEGMPMVALEALAAGVPVVSTDVEGMEELLGTGAGTVVGRDAASLAEAVVALIGAPERRAEMGGIGRERIAAEFSVGEMVASYRQLYSELA